MAALAPVVSAGALPRYATARTPSRRTRGRVVSRLARGMARPLLPWQQLVADVALEKLPDGSWAYTDVWVTVPRQSGKTTIAGPVGIDRALSTELGSAWFTAQTRQVARDAFMGKMVQPFTRSPFGRLGKLRRSQGSEGLHFAASGGAWRVFAPSAESLHSTSNHLVVTDEVWVWDDVAEAELRAAIAPTFATTGGQWWKLSTAGTAASTMLAKGVTRGRDAVTSGVDRRVAYFEWSLPDELRDVVEAGVLEGEGPRFEQALAHIRAHHPGVGFTLLDQVLRDDAAAAAEEGSAAGFLRGYGNLASETAETVVPAELWAAAAPPAWAPRPARAALALDVGLDGADAAVLLAWRDDAGVLWVDVADYRVGDTGWVGARLLELQRAYRAGPVAHDTVGPVVDVVDQAADVGVKLEPITRQQYAAAAAGIMRELRAGTLRQPGHRALDAAVAGAARRDLGDGSWGWGRRKSSTSISPLVAATIAAWQWGHQPPAPPRPRIVL